MRVTNSMMSNRLITSINKNLTNVDKYYTQMSSGKKIQMPSDNPILASRSLKLRTIVSETEQYKSNVEQANSWLDITETAMKNIEKLYTNIGELCVQGATDTTKMDDKQKIATEIQSLVSQIEDEMNTTYMGRYVFSGYKTDTPVVTKDDSGNSILNTEIYNSIEGQSINIEVGIGTYCDINSLSIDFFTQDIFNGLHSFDSYISDYESGKYESMTTAEKDKEETNLRNLFSSTITNIQNYTDILSNEHTKVGVKMSRLELTESRLTDDKTNYSTLLSNNENINLAEATMNWNVADVCYQAALKVGMNITKLTLADYL